jgi:hypothetical protein
MTKETAQKIFRQARIIEEDTGMPHACASAIAAHLATGGDVQWVRQFSSAAAALALKGYGSQEIESTLGSSALSTDHSVKNYTLTKSDHPINLNSEIQR